MFMNQTHLTCAPLQCSSKSSWFRLHRFQPIEDGDYQICFDNGVSTYYGKVVFFAFDEPGDDDDKGDDEFDDDNYFKSLVSEEFQQINEYDGKVNDFKVKVCLRWLWICLITALNDGLILNLPRNMEKKELLST